MARLDGGGIEIGDGGTADRDTVGIPAPKAILGPRFDLDEKWKG